MPQLRLNTDARCFYRSMPIDNEQVSHCETCSLSSDWTDKLAVGSDLTSLLPLPWIGGGVITAEFFNCLAWGLLLKTLFSLSKKKKLNTGMKKKNIFIIFYSGPRVHLQLRLGQNWREGMSAYFAWPPSVIGAHVSYTLLIWVQILSVVTTLTGQSDLRQRALLEKRSGGF